jgi:hypothetical protein
MKAIMKTEKYTFSKVFFVGLLLSFTSTSCDREDGDLVPATFPNTPDVFTDTFIGLGSDFYFPYLGAKPDVFSVDNNEGFESEASIRIDVPNSNDPGGSYAGAIFRIDGAGRDLTEYNALTFYAKASQAVTISEVGFGQNFLGDEFRAWRTGLDFTTNWKKYIIPIPDPSKLTEERGLFQFAAAGIGDIQGEELGYTFWLDDIRFENLGSVAQPLRKALDLEVIFNVDGAEVSVNAAAAYFDESDFDFAPTPPVRNANDVVSIFSDAYANVQVDNYNGFFQYSTTQGGATSIGNENFINYTDLNFVSINMFNSPDVDASGMTHIHVDVNVRESIQTNDYINFQIINNDGGASPSSGTVSLKSYRSFKEKQWVSYDIPLSDFTGLQGSNDIDLIFFVSDATVSKILIDNVYFYR